METGIKTTSYVITPPAGVTASQFTFRADTDIPQKLVIDSKLQYGSQDNVLFFVYHDKSQTPYQERFRCNELQKFVYNAVGISWMVGKYLVDV